MIDRYYLLKIQLVDIKPAIWRRVVVPASISLDRLHDVIQIVMEWEDRHLYEFIINKISYSEYLDFTLEDNSLPVSQFRLQELAKRKGKKFNYIYDFGDNWEHEIVLEDSNFKNETPFELFCLDGERASPPEDVGGTFGYSNFCKIISDPNHKQYQSKLEWIGYNFDSEHLDLIPINWLLIKYFNWSRFRELDWLDDDEIYF